LTMYRAAISTMEHMSPRMESKNAITSMETGY